MSDFKEIEQLAEAMKSAKEGPMAERPTPEQLTEIRARVAHAIQRDCEPQEALGAEIVRLRRELARGGR